MAAFTSGTDGRKSPSSSGPRKPRNPYTLYVSQLKEALPVTEEEIRTYFGPAATGIAGIKLVFDKPHRRGASSGKEGGDAGEVQRRQRPFAYVEFKDEAAMKEGMKRQGEVLKGETRPQLEQADSNKAAAGNATDAEGEKPEKKEKSERRERPTSAIKKEKAGETDKEDDAAVTGAKSSDESGRPARGGRGKKERGGAAVKKGNNDSNAAAKEAGDGNGTDTAAGAAGNHNKNKKQRNNTRGEKKDSRQRCLIKRHPARARRRMSARMLLRLQSPPLLLLVLPTRNHRPPQLRKRLSPLLLPLPVRLSLLPPLPALLETVLKTQR